MLDGVLEPKELTERWCDLTTLKRRKSGLRKTATHF